MVKAKEKFDDFNFSEKEEKIRKSIQEADAREGIIVVSRSGKNYTKKDINDMNRALLSNVSKWKIAYQTKNQAQVKVQVATKDEFEPDSPYSKFREFIPNEKISFDEAKNQEGKYTKLELLKLAMKLLPASDLEGNTTEGKITLVQNLLKSCIGLLAPKNLPALITRLEADRPELNIGPGATVKKIVEVALGYDIITKHEARLNEIKERELKAKEEAARQAAEAAKQQIAQGLNIVGAGAAVAAGAIPQVGGIQRSAQELEAEAKAREAHAKEMEAQARLLALQQAQQAQQAAANAAEKTAALVKRGKGL